MNQENDYWITVAIITFFTALAIAGTLETVEPVLKRDRVRDCVVSMGAATDSEINSALTQCARRFNYLINEEDWI